MATLSRSAPKGEPCLAVLLEVKRRFAGLLKRARSSFAAQTLSFKGPG